jgi:hypothetical protein
MCWWAARAAFIIRSPAFTVQEIELFKLLSVRTVSRRRNTMYRLAALAPTTMALLCLAIALPAGSAVAQQKQQVSFKTPAENAKYTQQQNIDVGDVPNHIVRVFELHYTFPDNAPVINGLRLVEAWARGIADYIDGSGPDPLYLVYVMENGDKFFSRTAGVVQSSSSGKLTATQAGTITGGTGRFAAIQGTVRVNANFDLKTGFNESQTEIEYSIGK